MRGYEMEDFVYLVLFHGSKEGSKEVIEDWGEDGPIFGPLKSVNLYGQELTLFFPDGKEGRIKLKSGLAYYNRMLYAHMTITRYHELMRVNNDYPPELTEFDQGLALSPVTVE